MAEDEPLIPEESRAKLRDCQFCLDVMENICPAAAYGLRKSAAVLRVHERWRYLQLMRQLVRNMSFDLLDELKEDPGKLIVFPESTQIRLMERALSSYEFLEIPTELIRGQYEYLIDAAHLTEELGSDEDSEHCSLLAQRILQLIPLLYLSSKGWGYVEGERLPHDGPSSRSWTPRPCIPPPVKGTRPSLRLVPPLKRGS